MKKKTYRQPSARIVGLQQQAPLLAGSIRAGRASYGTATEWTWGEGSSSSAPGLSSGDDEDFLEFLRFTMFVQ